jgi:hypothetical protein
LEAESGNGHFGVLSERGNIAHTNNVISFCVNSQAFFTVSICKIDTVVLYSDMNWSLPNNNMRLRVAGIMPRGVANVSNCQILNESEPL